MNIVSGITITIREILLSTFICFSFFSHGQNQLDLPYKGSSKQFDKDVAKSLIVEAGDSARIYFVEITYSNSKKEIETILHGVLTGDITTQMIESFFREHKNNGNKQFLKTSNIIIPLFISPINIDKLTETSAGKINIETFAKLIAQSFKAKKCYLYKPVYSFNQNIHIDSEPQ